MPPRAILTLYIVDGSSACTRAEQALDAALRAYPRGDIVANVRNLSRVVERTDSDRAVMCVPLLVVTHPVHEFFLDVDNPDEIVALLAGIGVPATAHGAS